MRKSPYRGLLDDIRRLAYTLDVVCKWASEQLHPKDKLPCLSDLVTQAKQAFKDEKVRMAEQIFKEQKTIRARWD